MPCAPKTGTFSSPAGDLFHAELTKCHWLLWTPGHWAKIVWGRNCTYTKCRGGGNEIGPWQRHRCVCFVKSSFKLWDYESSFRDYVLMNQLHSPGSIMVYLWILMCTHTHEDMYMSTICPYVYVHVYVHMSTLHAHTAEWTCRTTEIWDDPVTCSLLLPVKPWGQRLIIGVILQGP